MSLSTIWNWLWSSFVSLYELIRCAIRAAICDFLGWVWSLLEPHVVTMMDQIPAVDLPDLSPIGGWFNWADRFFPISFWVSSWGSMMIFIAGYSALRWVMRFIRGA